MIENVYTIAGYMPVSEAMYREIQRNKCQEASDFHYALLGDRSECVCGQHANPVPLAPLLTKDRSAD